ncbi:hypothetical protein BSZ21_06330 [Bradyrhizobium canariense]|nr:hypothetical protein BSZ21_06330 [Bradyrhizobium canariense]
MKTDFFCSLLQLNAFSGPATCRLRERRCSKPGANLQLASCMSLELGHARLLGLSIRMIASYTK